MSIEKVIYRYIYILELEDNKYYVGMTENVDKRMYSHFNGKGSEWTKLHKPVKIYKIFRSIDIFDEDLYTKKMMYYKGIDNVRGGSYSSIILDELELKFIQKEFLTVENRCFRCSEYGHYGNNCVEVMKFGKYKNLLLKDIVKFDENYMNWLIKQTFVTKDFVKKVKKMVKKDYRLCYFCELKLKINNKYKINIKHVKNRCSICYSKITICTIPLLRCDYCIKHDLKREYMIDGFCSSCKTKL